MGSHGLQHSRLLCPSTISQSLLKLLSVESVMPSNHLILCHPLLLLLSIFPSISVFSTESVLLIKWPKYWSLASASFLPMNIQGLISFRIDCLISLQSKRFSRVFSTPQVEEITLWHSALFMVQLSHAYLTTGKTIALTVSSRDRPTNRCGMKPSVHRF